MRGMNIMDIATIQAAIEGLLNSRYADLAIEIAGQALPYVFAFIGSALGARWGFQKYKKSDEYRFREQREFEAWRERKKVGFPDDMRQSLKDYFNEMTRTLSHRDPLTARAAIEAYPQGLVEKLKKSDVLHRLWDAYYRQILNVVAQIESDDRRGDTHHSWVKLFTITKARWLLFMNAVSAAPYDGDEIYDLMDMGIVPRDVQEGRTGDGQWHADGQSFAQS